MNIYDLKRKIERERVEQDILFTPQNSNEDILFESIQMPHWGQFVTPNDLDTLYWVATNNRLAAKFDKRKQYIEGVMNSRGFKFMAGGTNRMVYKHMEFPSIVAKIPIDKVGLTDNVAEFNNQRKIWPFCAKMIQVTPLGVIGFAERLEPVLNRYQFNAFAPMIYITTIQLIGKYVLEDIGTDFFKNWGVRRGYGACLLDYPYLYEVDGSKLICQQPMVNGLVCGGEVDYDNGFNHLYCKRCGHMYHASELKLNLDNETLKISRKRGGKKPMFVTFKKGDKVLASSFSSDSIIRPETRTKSNTKPTGSVVATLSKGKTILSGPTINLNVRELEICKADDNIDVVKSSISITPRPADEPEFTPVEPKRDSDSDKVDEDIAKRLKDTYVSVSSSHEVPDIVIQDDEKEDVIDDEEKEVVEEVKEPEPINEESVTSPSNDEYPPNQWAMTPSITSPRRRIISSSGSASNSSVKVRPNNPYKN